MWLTTGQLILVDYGSRIKEIFFNTLANSPIAVIPIRVEVNSAAPPSIKSIKYKTQQFQNALMDLVSH